MVRYRKGEERIYSDRKKKRGKGLGWEEKKEEKWPCGEGKKK